MRISWYISWLPVKSCQSRRFIFFSSVNIHESIILILVIHWCPDGGWEGGKQFKCTDRHPGSTHVLRHRSTFHRLLRVIEFLCILLTSFMHAVKGLFLHRLLFVLKKKPKNGLLLTSDVHIRKCNPRLVIVWFCSATLVELSPRLNLSGLGEMWGLILSKWNHWEAKQILINCCYSS